MINIWNIKIGRVSQAIFSGAIWDVIAYFVFLGLALGPGKYNIITIILALPMLITAFILSMFEMSGAALFFQFLSALLLFSMFYGLLTNSVIKIEKLVRF